MGVGSVLQRLGGFVDECEKAEPVEAVDLGGEIDSAGGDGVEADVELTLSACPPDEEFGLCATSVNADGTIRFGFETADTIVPQADDVEVEPAGATVGPDGQARITLSVSVGLPDDHEPAASSETSDDDGRNVDSESAGESEPNLTASSTSDRDLPPFKNPELLGEIYESRDTFAEMAEALDMDVTAETVRRYMIDFDIHEPNSYDTGGSDGDHSPDEIEQTPPVLSDGIGLPEQITVETLIDTVERSNTIYEVKRDLGVDREDALEVLRECNLLDLVMCRLATEAERDINREDVIERLRAASTAG
ncbi:MAG: hypothetical protein V5A39_05955 [Haloarculaceae archaeon]